MSILVIGLLIAFVALAVIALGVARVADRLQSQLREAWADVERAEAEVGRLRAELDAVRNWPDEEGE